MTTQMPCSLENERALLGTVLYGEGLKMGTAAKVFPVLPESAEEAFTLNQHRTIWRVIASMHARGKPIDVLTFKVEAKRTGDWGAIGGDDVLTELAEGYCDIANAEHYALEVKRAWERRKLFGVAHEMLRRTTADDADPSAIAADAVTEIATIQGETGSFEGPQDAGAIFRGWLAEIAERGEDFQPHRQTGIENIDAIIGGVRPGDMVVIAARPSMGKTALALNIASRMSGTDYPTLFISLEMPKRRLIERVVSRLSNIGTRELREIRARDVGTIERIQRFEREMDRMAMKIADTCGRSQTGVRTANYVMSMIRRDVIARDTRAVLVDYLGLLDMAGNGREPRYFRVQQMSAAFKALAVELGITVFLVCQLNREAAGREAARPRMSDLRESGAIEQDADAILLLHRPAYFNESPDPRILDYAECIVAKNRDGETGTAALRWTAQFQRFASMDADEAAKCRELIDRPRSRSTAKRPLPIDSNCAWAPDNLEDQTCD